MKTSDFIATFEHFFLDIIGTIIPGTSFILGCWIILDMPARFPKVALLPPTDMSTWVLLIAAGYAIGHAIASLATVIFVPAAVTVAEILRKYHLGKLVPAKIITNAKLFKSIRDSGVYQAFYKAIEETYPGLISDTSSIHEARSIAMTIDKEEKDIIYKFMFLSLLNSGMATTLCSVSLLWLILSFMNWVRVATISIMPLNGWIVITMLVGSLFFFERSSDFFERAMKTPFSMALGQLVIRQPSASPTTSVAAAHRSGGQEKLPGTKVYLAGGFKSGWQDRILSVTSNLSLYDPRSHGLADEALYTLWDLEAIRRSDWIFAYLEETNPAGYALALEIGFAKALGKRVLLVDEKSASDKETRRSMGMVRAAADVTFEAFKDGLDYLKMLEKTI